MSHVSRLTSHVSRLTSIIVPAYNAESKIEQTLRTIILQTYSQYEVIIINDASTDNTEQTARNFLNKHNVDFQIITHEKNKGVSAARNTGIKAAHGEYICFVDADDRIEENYLSLLCAKAEKENADIVLCGYKIHNESKNTYDHRDIKLKRELRSARDYFPAWLMRKIPSNIWSCLFRKKFLEDNNLMFHEGCHFSEDEEFLVKALSASQCTSFLNELLYVYVIHDRQEDTFRPLRKNYDWLNSLLPPRMRAVRYILRHSSDDREKSYAIFYLAWAIERQFKICARLKDKERYTKYIRMLRHKKIREILLHTSKIFLRAPDSAFKALFLLYFPRLYYIMKSVI